MASLRLEIPSMQNEYPPSPDTTYDELQLPHIYEERSVNFQDNLTVYAGGHFPYTHAYKENVGFEHFSREVFLPGVPVEAKIVHVETISLSTNILSPNIYFIELQHANFHWKIKRRYIQFLNLHRQLKMHQASLKIPLPIKAHREARSFRNTVRKIQAIPKFPITQEMIIGHDRLNRRAMQLERYLNAILQCAMFRNYHETLAFLEVSHLSFVDEIGGKLKEGMVKKRAGGERITAGCIGCSYALRSMFSSWLERWLLVRDTFLAVIRPRDGLTREILLMDAGFRIEMGFYKTGRRTGLTVINQNRKLTFSGQSRERTDEWFYEINLIATTTAKEFTQANRFGSFAPVRSNTWARWFVDGAAYFDAIARAINNAKEEIFITDWMLSPELFMKRPIRGTDEWRLDKILQRKAEEGIKVYVLLYKEVEMALAINSDYARKRLMCQHKNIKVLRHPDHLPSGVLIWAHHEKIVLIDQTLAFVGGFDLCFGRWDSYQHKLLDIGLEKVASVPCERFSRSSFIVGNMSSALQNLPLPGLGDFSTTDVGEDKPLKLNGELRPQIPNSLDVLSGKKFWPGKDYMNFIFKDFSNLDKPFEDLIDRKKITRMPWHDVGIAVQGKAARDVGRHFIQRWNAVKVEKMKDNPLFPLLFPRSYQNLDEQQNMISRMRSINCQVLRSASRWSAGIKDTEDSIHQAYIKIISEAEHFIYIENQFFISLTENNSYVSNKIANALYERIVRAHRAKEIFRVYVVMPLLPAFEGDIGTLSGIALQAIIHWNYASICRGADSLYERLRNAGCVPTNYLTFYGLRTHEQGCGQQVSELVYVHSKMIIVDDRIAVIGSANINDRSMKGDRDSEIAVIVEDTDFHESRMAGKIFAVGEFVSSLRRYIFREHLGLLKNPALNIDVIDPVSDKFFKEVWLTVASRNTDIFEKVFRCIPNDNIHTFAQLRQYSKEAPLSETKPDEASLRLKEVQGHLVLLPLYFLKNETLTPPVNSREGLVPTYLWT